MLSDAFIKLSLSSFKVGLRSAQMSEIGVAWNSWIVVPFQWSSLVPVIEGMFL